MGTPTGTVSFFDGSTLLDTETLNSYDQASTTISTLALGDHSITATFSGDDTFSGSTSSTLIETVSQPSTYTELSSSQNPAAPGQAVTFTAFVNTYSYGVGTPTGTVSFFDGSTLLDTETLNSYDQASTTISTLALGDHSITVAYSGDDTFSGSTSSTLIETVSQPSTYTELSSNANPAAPGQAVTFTAFVSTYVSGVGTPTGTVGFYDGTTLLDTETLNGYDQASTTISTLALGNHSITVTYSGDTTYSGSTSSTLIETVSQPSTYTELSSNANPAEPGQAVTFTAFVDTYASGVGTPTGTVSFFDGSTLLDTETLNSYDQASTTISTLTLGDHSITVAYTGDDTFSGSTSYPLIETVSLPATSTYLSSSEDPSSPGDAVTFTAYVYPDRGGSPTGTVSFYDGSTLLDTETLNGSEQASFTTSGLALGEPPITADYSGDTTFSGSTSYTLTQTVSLPGTYTYLSSSEDPSSPGDAVTFTAYVYPDRGSNPTGTVSFYDGDTLLDTETLNGYDQASFTTSGLALGEHPITADYSGDTTFSGSTSYTLIQTVSQPGTSTWLSSNVSPSAPNEAVTFTAWVYPDRGGTPTGTVTFADGGTVLGTGALNADSEATLTTSVLTLGDHSITATYGGDSTFTSSTSYPLIQTVEPIAPIATNDAYTLSGSTTLGVGATAGVLANDSDADPTAALTAVLFSGPAHGTLTFSSTGSFVYVPTLGFLGTDAFEYQAVADGLDSAVATVTLTVTAAPTFTWTQTPTPPPVLTSVANQTNDEGDTVSVQVSASDPNSYPLTFTAVNLPAGLSIGASTGLISGTVAAPAAEDFGGVYPVIIDATNGHGGAATESFTWTVSPNPVSVWAPAKLRDFAGDSVSFQVSAADSSGGTLAYSATGLPGGLTIDASTGSISGTVSAPGSESVTFDATLSATDGPHSASANVAWTVTTLALESPGAQSNLVGDTVLLPLTAIDTGTPTFSATGLHAGLSINAGTGLIFGTPTSAGSSSVTVTANDAGNSASVTFTWNVAALQLSNPGNQTNTVGDSVNLPLTATSSGSGALTFSATGLPG